MNSHFKLLKSGTIDDRPPMSFLVDEYFEIFVTNKVLRTKSIIVESKWNIYLSLIFVGDGPKVLFDRMAFIEKPRTVRFEQLKIYTVLIRYNQIEGAKDPYLKTIELIYEAISMFLTTVYKKVSRSFMDELWLKIDLDYLLSLPYPAPFEDQKYVADDQRYKRDQKGNIKSTTLEEQAERTGYQGKF